MKDTIQDKQDEWLEDEAEYWDKIVSIEAGSC
jgi:hypothetical protein